MAKRREFLKNAAMSGAAAGFAAAGFWPRRTFSQEKDGYDMAFRELGSTGFKVTEIGFGAMNTRDGELLTAALDHGVNYIDTAFVYQRGNNEEMVGEVMKGRDRDKVFITTKAMGKDPKELMRQVETSLARLQMDHVDLLLHHAIQDPADVRNDDHMKVFEEARKKGMTRFVGISTHANQAATIDAAVESKFWEAVLVGYNYFSPANIKPAIARARTAGLATIGMKNLLNPATQPWSKLDDMRSGDQKKSGITPAQALIKWVLDDRNIDTTVPGMTSFEQLYEDLPVMGMKMTFDDRDMLRRYTQSLDAHYCRGVAGCTDCQEQCPFGVHVNDINRCLAYANSYGDEALAWENYRNLPAASRLEACSDCDECVVKCAHGIDVAANITRAKELFA